MKRRNRSRKVYITMARGGAKVMTTLTHEGYRHWCYKRYENRKPRDKLTFQQWYKKNKAHLQCNYRHHADESSFKQLNMFDVEQHIILNEKE